ncbi:hypothetical protein Cs7R123_69330 [Catellatospora sp. TT07R-123]|uniref:hypothetical protein n=1 Tax=Catellatospora sp. TT07R-123 TaxID=2733863 RepID=UPI001B2334B9|nr:hypothetical protein [Catellatospora sp. TT07R-123]GHJ49591.1 hypothetical protein Cs7R123_69330 [Catellatospora sp. TT07R-123]
MDNRHRLLSVVLGLTAAVAAAVITSCAGAPAPPAAQQPAAQAAIPAKAVVLAEAAIRGGKVVLWTDPAETFCWHVTNQPKKGGANTVGACGDGKADQATRLFGVVVVLAGCDAGEVLVRTNPDAEPVRYVVKNSAFLIIQPTAGEIGEKFGLACGAAPDTFRDVFISGT